MSFGLGSAAFPAFSPTIDGKLRPFLKSADPSDAIATPFKILRVCGKPSSAQCAMGNSVTRVVGCFVPGAYDHGKLGALVPNPALDEGLGHSFCYVRPSSDAVNLSPSHSDRYSSELHSSSFRSHRTASDSVVFKTISGASVSANTSTPHTIISHEQLHSFTNVPDDRHAAFESSGSFVSIPLQPVPRGVTFSGPISSTFSGPMPASLERVFRSGPLELSHMSGPMDGIQLDQTHFSAPLAGPYNSKRSRGRRHLSRLFYSFGRPAKGLLSKTISSTLARTHRSLVVPVRQFVRQRVRTGGKDAGVMYDSGSELRYPLSDADPTDSNNLQWAQGKAGEDRVHVVVSEDHGWLFVGIYDGFNGPDAPDFLMRNLYTAVYRELQGLLWDAHRCSEQDVVHSNPNEDAHFLNKRPENGGSVTHMAKDVPSGQDHHVCSTHGRFMRSRTLREYLDDTDSDDDSFGSQNANSLSSSFSMPLTSKEVSSCCRKHANREHNQAVSLAQASSNVSEGNVEDGPGNDERDFEDNRRGSNMNCHAMITSPSGLTGKGIPQPSFGSKQMKKKESHRKFLPQRENLSCNCSKSDGEKSVKGGTNLQRERAIDHGGVLAALSQALLETEEAYFNMADLAMGDNPELLLMGSCILVALVKDKDVYILNVGDSRAIVAQEADRSCPSYPCSSERAIGGNGLKDAVVQNDLESILEDSPAATEMVRGQMEMGAPPSSTSLLALQLSQDHSTSIEEEVQRLQLEHPDDNMCIFNDRVKGRLKVTRAFGAGFLKKPRWNNAVLKMFQIDYVGSDPYVTCTPALRHHRLGSNDRFLVLSSDGLYQYFSNDEVVSHVEWFMQKFPEGDPAQHLIEELLFRAAKKAGMDFHELLDIPQGDRRKYHDDVSVMVISLEGKVWKSSS